MLGSSNIASRFASLETGHPFGKYCKSLGTSDPLFWQKVYTRINLEYTSQSPRGNDTVDPTYDINDPSIVAHYFHIIETFAEFLNDSEPLLIGNCDSLPYPKKVILYAIPWLLNYYNDVRERSDRNEEWGELHSSLSFLLTILCDRWHKIDSADKEAISKLQGFDSFPIWAIPLKDKYISEDKSRNEAMEAAHEAMADRAKH